MMIVRMRTIIETIAVSISLLALSGIIGLELLYLSGVFDMVLILLELLCA